MLIYFWVVLVISPAGFLEDLLGSSAICVICDSNHIVSMLKCMCSQNKVIHSFNFSPKWQWKLQNMITELVSEANCTTFLVYCRTQRVNGCDGQHVSAQLYPGGDDRRVRPWLIFSRQYIHTYIHKT